MTAVLGIDLALKRWVDNGSAVVEFSAEGWTSCMAPAIAWRDDAPPTATALASAIDEFARSHDITAVSIDGPQGWRDPRRPLGKGVGRVCELDARTPGKTGVLGVTFPSNYLAWVSLSIELFARLRALPHVTLVNDVTSALERPSDGGYYLIECFPTVTWRSSGLTPLPGKAKRPSSDNYARSLSDAYGLEVPPNLGHDDLQAVVAALPAAALLGAPAKPVAHGVTGSLIDGNWTEGLIWDCVPTRAALPVATRQLPLLVVVTGPPGAGKTTIAAAVAERLALPLLAKDSVKERLHDGLGGEGRDWSRRLGVATFEVLFDVLDELLRNDVSVVAEGNFSHAERFRALPQARLIQVHVSASPDVLRERFANRATRHAVHYDAEVTDEVPARVAAGEWEPLDVGGALVQVDTSIFPDVADVVNEVVAVAATV